MDKPDLEAVTARRASVARLSAEIDVKRAALLSEDQELAVAERALNRLEHIYGRPQSGVGGADQSDDGSPAPDKMISAPVEPVPETAPAAAIAVLQRLGVQTLQAGREGWVAVRTVVEKRKH